MINNRLHFKRALHAALFVLLLSVVGMTKLQAQNITFADANVKAICVANWDTNGDGELNQAEAAVVTSLDGMFMFDDEITTFDELSFFTGLTAIGEDEFNSCTSLTAISIPNAVTAIGNYAFSDCSSLMSITSYAFTPPTLGSNVFDNVLSALVVNVPCGTSALYQTANGWSDLSNYEEFVFDLCPITFADANVKAICVAHWDTNSDGELNYAEAAAVTNLGTYFKSTTITSFDELEYFTSLTSLPNTAFYGCTSLASITLPSSVSALGNGSFYNCTSLATMTVYAETPPTVGTNAFKNVPTSMVVHVSCGAYEAYHNANDWNVFSLFNPCPIVFADANVKSLCVANWDTNGDGELSYAEAAAVTDLGTVFKNNSNILSFDELQYFIGLSSIGSYAFYYCSGLITIEIPNSVTSIGSYTFRGCSGLTSIEIPNSVTSIGTYVFYGCSGLTSIEISNSVTSIGSNAFYGCSSLTSIEIPNSVTSIGSYTFSECTGLTSIEIPNSVTSISNNAFQNCSGLEQIIVASGNTVYDSRDNCNAIIKTSTNELVAGCKNTTVPNSVTSIGSYAFYYCSGLTTIEIPSSVTSIGSYAFYYCSGLASMTVLAANPPTLGSFAFYNVNKGIPVYVSCGNVAAYTSPRWGGFNNIFGLCGGLVTVTASPEEGGTMTGGGTFGAGETCTVTATANEGYAFTFWTREGMVVSTDAEYTFFVTNDMDLVAHFVPDANITFADVNVKALCVANWDINGDGELSYAEAAAVTSLGQVFKNNTSIVSFNELQYFNGLTSIGSYAFSNCSGLTTIEIPNSVTSIGSSAFSYCSGLTTIEIPNSVTSIGSSAFSSCSGLTTIEIPNSVTSIGNYVFSYCSGLTSIEIPNSVTSIGSYAFYYCSGLTTIEIPNSVTSISDRAFYHCSGLTTIEIPNSVTSIGSYAFSNCSGLTSMTVLAANPPTLGNNAFYNVNKEIPVYVPCGSVEAYTAANWGGFNNLNGLCGGTVTVVANPTEGGMVSGGGIVGADETCTVTATANEGYAFAIWTLDGTVVSADVEYTFYVPNDMELVAQFVPDANITFVNANVKSLCVANWDTNRDGELSYAEAAAVTDLGMVFENNSNIISFDELQYFIGLTSIGSYTFSYCRGLTTIDIPNSVTSIGSYAFSNCSGLTSVTVLAANPSTLGNNAFYNVNKEIPVYVPCGSVEAYTAANWGGFNNLDGLCGGTVSVAANLAEGGTVTGSGTFVAGETCTVMATANEGYAFAIWTRDGTVVSTNAEYTFYVPSDMELVAHFVPNANITFADANVKSLCVTHWDTNGDGELSYAEAAAVTNLGQVFKNKPMLISFDELQYFIGLTSIGSDAFYYCRGLTTIEIPNSVTTIGYEAFYYCRGLTTIEIPNSVTTIGYKAFSGCSGLTTIEIPNSMTSIGNYVFSGCSGLEQIIVDSGNTVYDSRDNCNAIINTSTNELETGCKNTVIPNTVTSIGYGAFYGCSSLISIEIPNTVTSIGYRAFYDCSGLTYMIVLADNPPTLGDFNFYEENQFIPVYVPCGSVEAYTTINWGGFNNFVGLCGAGEITVTANPTEGGTVTGGGYYEAGATCTLTATTNEDYVFLYWTENDTVVSVDNPYSFLVGGDRNLVANFAEGEACSIVFDISLIGGGGSVGGGGLVPDKGRNNYDDYFVIDYGDGNYEQIYMVECSYSRPIATGSHITITWISDLSMECNFMVYYEDGDMIYQSDYIEPNFEYSFNVNCSGGNAVTQTINLSQGWNWFSTYLDITLDDLENALLEALPGTTINIKSQTQNVKYQNGRWTGSLTALDMTQMYMISVENDCEITLEGTPINPSTLTVTINNGANWIAFPYSESMTVTDFFGSFPMNNDQVKSQSQNAKYQGNRWAGQLNTLVPGKGYTYISNTQGTRTFTFPASAK